MISAEVEYLQLSGIQHFCFCRRQWALIHLEEQWSENVLTAEGRIDHERCHDSSVREKRRDLLTVRGMRVASARLGLSGNCDVVEFRCTTDGVPLEGEEGLWLPTPVEYKHGTRQICDADRLQVCAQAMALEEMLVCDIPYAFIFYESERRRERVELTEELRGKTVSMAKEMHEYAARGYTPRPKRQPGCRSCSLRDVCLPVLGKIKTVGEYINEYVGEEV